MTVAILAGDLSPDRWTAGLQGGGPKRLADRLHAPWTAVTIETPRTAELPEAARDRIDSTRAASPLTRADGAVQIALGSGGGEASIHCRGPSGVCTTRSRRLPASARVRAMAVRSAAADPSG